MADVTAVIPAAGSGIRMGDTPDRKQYMRLADKPVLEWTINAFSHHEAIESIVLVVPPDDVDAVRDRYIEKLKIQKLSSVTEGGDKRGDSVYRGLLEASTEFVLIHDGVRPFASADLIQKTIRAAKEHGAATAALPAQDTLKFKNGNFLGEHVDRGGLLLIQTPQVFVRKEILKAFEKLENEKLEWTDETSLMQKIGHSVAWVQGEPGNIKITTPEDFRLAERIMGKGP